MSSINETKMLHICPVMVPRYIRVGATFVPLWCARTGTVHLRYLYWSLFARAVRKKCLVSSLNFFVIDLMRCWAEIENCK